MSGTTTTDAKLIRIAKSLASFLASRSYSFAVAEVIVGGFTVVDIEQHGVAPKIYVESSGEVNELEDTLGATRDSRMLEYSLTVQIVDYCQFGTAEELADLAKLSEEIRGYINRTPQAGAEYWSINREQPVEDFNENELEQGLYYRQVFSVEYVDTE